MSWVRVYMHMIFSTKNREPLLSSYEIRKKVFQHMKANAAEKNIWLDSINGYADHAHCLISLQKDQSISTVAQLIKGESSHWINKNQLIKNKFSWQDDYWAVGVSESHLQPVRNYIHAQELHHSRRSFEEEINEFMAKYEWTLIQA